MGGFTKLWQCILSSSIWNEDDKTRIVWITLLALKEEDGVARASVGGLAHMARVSKEDTEKAIKVLESPDLDSRSAEFEGRRIEKVDGGFRILNHEKYRESFTDKQRKAYSAEYMAERRKEAKEESKKEDTDTDTDTVNLVNTSSQKLTKVNKVNKIRHREFIKPSKEECVEYGKEIGFDGEEFFDGCESRGWVVGKGGLPMKCWKATMRTWKKIRENRYSNPKKEVDYSKGF